MQFIPIENLIYSSQKESIDFLFQYDLLKKLNKDVRSVLTHFLITKIHETLNENVYFVFNQIPSCLELCEYFDCEKLQLFYKKLLVKINKMVNYRIVMLEKDIMFPHEVDDTEELSFWFGEFYDEFITQTSKTNSKNTTMFKKFLKEKNLFELQEKFQMRKII